MGQTSELDVEKALLLVLPGANAKDAYDISGVCRRQADDAQSRLQWSKPGPTGLHSLNTTATRGGDERRKANGGEKEGYSQNEGGGEE